MTEEEAQAYFLAQIESTIFRTIMEAALARLDSDVVLDLTESFRASVLTSFDAEVFGPGAADRLEKILDDLQAKYCDGRQSPPE